MGTSSPASRDTLPEIEGLWEWFDTAVVYEGESAYLQLTEAVESGGDFSKLPNLIYKDEYGIHVNTEVCAETLSELPPPDFDGLPLEKYFVPHLILPYLATRGCYYGRCTFCDHFQGYVEGFRTKQVDQITWRKSSSLKINTAPGISISPMSPIPRRCSRNFHAS